MAINNPLIPGDPYSYDLKWLVAKVKEILAQLGTLDEAIEAKIFEGFLEHSIVQFKTVEEMLAADIKDGSIVLTLGYHEAGDQGGLFYLVKNFNPSQCELDYFLALDNDKQIAIPVIVTPYVTPEMFGAYGDEINDDTQSITTAINASGSRNLPVLLSAKTYNISSTIVIDKGGMIFKGENSAKTIINKQFNGPAFTSNTSEPTLNNVLEGFRVRSTGYTGAVFDFTNPHASRISSLTMIDVVTVGGDYGLNIENSYKTLIDRCHFFEATVENVRLNKCTNIRFTNCETFDGPIGLHLKECFDVVCMGFCAQEHTSDALQIEFGCSNVSIIGSYFEKNQGYAVNIMTSGGNKSRDIVILGNYIVPYTSGSGTAINIEDVNQCLIVANYTSSYTTGVSVNAAAATGIIMDRRAGLTSASNYCNIIGGNYGNPSQTTGAFIGDMLYNRYTNKPCWWNGSAWLYADGSAV